MKNPSMGFIAGLAVLSVQSASPSIAATTIGQVALGTDYFQTTFTVIDFGGVNRGQSTFRVTPFDRVITPIRSSSAKPTRSLGARNYGPTNSIIVEEHRSNKHRRNVFRPVCNARSSQPG